MRLETGEITLLLAKWRGGEDAVFDQLMPLVYPHLRQVAAAYIRRERNPDVLQATALVHELYLKLLDQKKVAYEDRGHFYTFSAKVMRRILIDHARGNQAQMRGGGSEHVPLSDDLPWVDVGSEDLLELNRALDELNAVDAVQGSACGIALLSWLHSRGNGRVDAHVEGNRGSGHEIHQELALSAPASGSR